MLIQSVIEHLPIADNSIDLIFTDPPYPVEYLECYKYLAEEAARVLRPGGFVLAMCGGIALNKVFRYFDNAGLDYFWKYEMVGGGIEAGIIWKHANGIAMPINTHSKPILAYSKGKATTRTGVLGTFTGTGNDKRYHHWGQDISSARYYIDCHSQEGDLVLDPFIGGGTTAVACELIGRRWIGCDIDSDALTTTALRISDAKIPKQVGMLL